MTPKAVIIIAALAGLVLAVAAAALIRLPLPFDGFAAVFAAGLAFIATLAITAWMPASWVWSDADRLRFAFQRRHNLSNDGAKMALTAIVDAHTRAGQLRRYGAKMRDDVQAAIGDVANRLDAAAREIFYAPDRHRALRSVLVRSALIEEAAQAHAQLKSRAQKTTEDASRRKLLSAVAALDAAFDQTDLLAAKGLLNEVSVASGVAEKLLTPRNRLSRDSIPAGENH